MVDTTELEPDHAQSTLEALYQAEWINYPRSDTTKVLLVLFFLILLDHSRFSEDSEILL